MNQRERDIESLLYSHPDLLPPLWFSGGGVSRWLARQYSVPSGRIDLLGVADFPSYKSLVVVELKSGAIDSRAVAQVCRYANDLQHILDAVCSKVDGLLTESDSKVHKVLIGERIDRKVFLEAEGVGAICLGHQLQDGVLSVGRFELAGGRRWNDYAQLADDSPFEYWMRQAQIEREYIKRGHQ